MSITQLVNNVKYLDDKDLQQKLHRPDGSEPPWILLQEVQRRKSGEQQAALAQSGKQTSTVMEDLLNGVNSSGLASAAPQGMPKQDNMMNMKTASAAPTQGQTSAMTPSQPPAQQGIKGYAGGGMIGDYPRTNYIMDWANSPAPDPESRLEAIGQWYNPEHAAKSVVRGISGAAEGIGAAGQGLYDYLTEPIGKAADKAKTEHDYQVSDSYGPGSGNVPLPRGEMKTGLSSAVDQADLGYPENIVPEQRGGPARKTEKADTGTVLKGLEQMISSGQESDKNFNKWLAVAKMGMTMASSKNQSFAGAVGEGGLAAASQLGQMNKQYKEAMEKAFNKNIKLAQLKETQRYHDASIGEQRYATDASLGKAQITHESNLLKLRDKEANAMEKFYQEAVENKAGTPENTIIQNLAETQGPEAARKKARELYKQVMGANRSAVTGQENVRRNVGSARGLY